MTLLFAVQALIVAAAVVLAAELLRPEPVSEKGLADLNEALTARRDYAPLVRLFDKSEFSPSNDLPLGEGTLGKSGKTAVRKCLYRLRKDFLTAWAVCRLLAPISRDGDPTAPLFRYWLRFHWLFAAVWLMTFTGQSAYAASQVQRLLSVFGDLRQWASELMQLDAVMGSDANQLGA